MPFVGELDIRDLGEHEFVLLENLDYLTLSGNELIRVHAGFVTDFASIPRALRWLFTVNGRHKKAAVIHDFLYANKGEVEYFHFTRKECDQIFEQAMMELGVGFFTRRTMYLGVRLGGWAYFND